MAKFSRQDGGVCKEEVDGSFKIHEATPRGRDSERYYLTTAINDLMTIAGVQVRFSWKRTGVEFELGADNLVGVLAKQLALSVTLNEKRAMCHNCLRIFETKRRRRNPAQRAWCDRDECKRRAVNQAKKDYRLRLKKARG